MTINPKRVFIVEDEVLVAFEMSDTLNDMGFEVVGPSIHLADAEKRAGSSDIDIAFLDVNLGKGKTSEPVAKILKSRGIPFVYITAYERSQVSFLTETDKLMRKPVSSYDLADILQDMLDRNAAQD